METKQLKSYNLGSFTLATNVDEKGKIKLVATNKAKNFSITWGADTPQAAAVPTTIDEAEGEDLKNVKYYMELLLNMTYYIANTPLPVSAYEEMLVIIDKYIGFKGELPADITQEQLEEDLALAHAAEDVNTEEKINKLADDVQKELESNTTNKV